MFRALCRFPPDLLGSASESLRGGSIYLINSVDKYNVLCFASPTMQHHSFSRN